MINCEDGRSTILRLASVGKGVSYAVNVSVNVNVDASSFFLIIIVAVYVVVLSVNVAAVNNSNNDYNSLDNDGILNEKRPKTSNDGCWSTNGTATGSIIGFVD